MLFRIEFQHIAVLIFYPEKHHSNVTENEREKFYVE